MRFSHSRIECFRQCRKKFEYRYIKKLEVIPDDDSGNALYLGLALHDALELGIEQAIENYYSKFPIVTDDHITEMMKLEVAVKKVELPEGGCFEYKLETDSFVGFIDYMVEVSPGVWDLFDFKYSNNIKNYEGSTQLALYAAMFEKITGDKVRNLCYIFVPKVTEKQFKVESLQAYRDRMISTVERMKVRILKVERIPDVLKDFEEQVSVIETCESYPKSPSYLCRFCDYQKLCEESEDYMILPKNERRTIEGVSKKSLWVYGAPFSGKTTFANGFPDPLMLNTDGNIKFVDAPYIPIRDEVTVEGRITKRELAWKVFKDTIVELEKKQNDFKTIVVDLLEDTYEFCRLYMYDKLKISHESDDSFRAWDKVQIEFLGTFKRLLALDYENIILISHEDTTKDLMKSTGDKVTEIKPNLRPKTANKIAGMVDVVARIVANEGVYTLSFKSSEVVFGGGRIKVGEREIPLNYERLCEVYETALKVPLSTETEPKKRAGRKKIEPEVVPEEPAPSEEVQEEPEEVSEEVSQPGETAPKRRERKPRDKAAEATPRRARRKRGE